MNGVFLKGKRVVHFQHQFIENVCQNRNFVMCVNEWNRFQLGVEVIFTDFGCDFFQRVGDFAGNIKTNQNDHNSNSDKG
ncbi:hypothetical protein D3C80_766550 [compost metagenome]